MDDVEHRPRGYDGLTSADSVVDRESQLAKLLSSTRTRQTTTSRCVCEAVGEAMVKKKGRQTQLQAQKDGRRGPRESKWSQI